MLMKELKIQIIIINYNNILYFFKFDLFNNN